MTFFDSALSETVRQAKQVPVLINYSVNNHRFEKKVDKSDLDLINTIDSTQIPQWFPSSRLMNGKETRRNDPIGLTHAVLVGKNDHPISKGTGVSSKKRRVCLDIES